MSFFTRALGGASVLVLVACAATPSYAETIASPERASIVVIGQRTAAAAARDVAQTPGGADIVQSEAFANSVAVSLRDTLAFSPGVYTQPRFGQEVRLSIRGSGISRGYHMRGILLFQDGIPINLADNNGDFQEFDPQVLDRIEVYRGGNALRLGGSTLGGAINAVTPTGSTAPGIALGLDGGSFDTLRTKAAVGFESSRGDAYLALTTDRSDGDRDHARRDAIRFNGNAGLRLSDTVETRFYATINHINQDLPGALTRAQALATPKLSLPGNILGDQERDIDSLRLQNRTTIDFGRGSAAIGAFVNHKQLFHPIFQVLDQKSVDYGAFVRVDLAGTVAGMALEASLGSTARFGHINARQFVNVAGRRGARTAASRQEARTVDSYGELRLKPMRALSLIAGGVHSAGRREVRNHLNPGRSGAASFDSFSPKLGILYEPLAGVQFYGNYSRSVEFPGLMELNQTPFVAGGVLPPGFVDVAPQKAWTMEVGARGALGPAAWDVTVYRARVRGELLQFEQAAGVPASTFNADRTRHQGIEAGLDLQLARWLRLRQVYQLNDFRFQADAQFGNNRLPVVPKHLYRAELRLGGDRFAVTPNLEWVPTGAWADYRNTVRAPGYALLGARAEAEVRDGIALFVDARNLANRKAIGDISAVIRATVPGDPAAAGPPIYYPVERRAVYGGIRAHF